MLSKTAEQHAKARRLEADKALRAEAEQRLRASEDARMPISRPQLMKLFAYLKTHLSNGCDDTLTVTRSYLQSSGLAGALIIPWLGKYGGRCDCEVLSNVQERWGTPDPADDETPHTG